MSEVLKQELERLNISKEEITQEAINQHFLVSANYGDKFAELFLELGADPNFGGTASMQKYVDRKDISGVRMLKKYGGKVDVNLCKQIENGNIEFVQEMFEEEAKYIPVYLEKAIKIRNCDMIDLLMKQEGAKVTVHEVREALQTTVDVVQKILCYTENKFPKNTFISEEYPFSNHDFRYSRVAGIINLPYETLKFVLDALLTETGSKMFYYMGVEGLDCGVIESLRLRLEKAVEEADYVTMEYLLEYITKNRIRFEYGSRYDYSCLVENCESTEELNKILLKLKEYGMLDNKLYYVTKQFYSKASLETLKIIHCGINKEVFIDIAKSGNKKLMQQILDTNYIDVTDLF